MQHDDDVIKRDTFDKNINNPHINNNNSTLISISKQILPRLMRILLDTVVYQNISETWNFLQSTDKASYSNVGISSNYRACEIQLSNRPRPQSNLDSVSQFRE